MFEKLRLPEKLQEEINQISDTIEIPENSPIVSRGDFMNAIPFVKQGRVRVFIQNNDIDKEQLLYYVNDGETCLMSMIASFGDKKSLVDAISETPSSIVSVPNHKIRQWQQEYTEWNALVMDLFINRYQELLHTIDELSFKKIDERLLSYLKNSIDEKGTVDLNKSHKQIAYDLSTSREVITRSLKKLQIEGKISRINKSKFTIL